MAMTDMLRNYIDNPQSAATSPVINKLLHSIGSGVIALLGGMLDLSGNPTSIQMEVVMLLQHCSKARTR